MHTINKPAVNVFVDVPCPSCRDLFAQFGPRQTPPSGGYFADFTTDKTRSASMSYNYAEHYEAEQRRQAAEEAARSKAAAAAQAPSA